MPRSAKPHDHSTSNRPTSWGRPATSARQPVLDDAKSWAGSPAVRRRMQRQQTRDTQPELTLRRALWAAGLRYRVDVAPLRSLRRRADVVFRPSRVAVFVDGCFWHGCPEHGSRRPKTNSAYWDTKVSNNRRRDADTDAQLSVAGWISLRVWEHEDATVAAGRIVDLVKVRRRERWESEPSVRDRNPLE